MGQLSLIRGNYSPEQRALMEEWYGEACATPQPPEWIYSPATVDGVRIAGEVNDGIKSLVSFSALLERKNLESHELSKEGGRKDNDLPPTAGIESVAKLNIGALKLIVDAEVTILITEQFPELKGKVFRIEHDWTLVSPPDPRENII